MSRLERRCRRLLRAYPQPYRAERGEEILATVLDAAPDDRRWPPAREARSLIAGGLRVRAARNRQLPVTVNLRLAALLAAALWLTNAVTTFLNFATDRHMYQLPAAGAALFAACALGSCLAIASAWLWPRAVTVGIALAVTAAAALACSQSHLLGDWSFDVRLIGPPLAVAALATGKDRPPRSWLWMPGAFLVAPLPALFPDAVGQWWPLAFALFPVTFFVVLGVSLLWFAADARPAIAFGVYFEAIYVIRGFGIAPQLTGAETAGVVLVVVLLAAALAGAALRTRRHPTWHPVGDD
jgi:hypothetical protein